MNLILTKGNEYMNKSFAILSAISFILYALVDFVTNVLETYFYVLLVNGTGNFSNSTHLIDAMRCKTVLLAVGVICLVAFIASLFVKTKE